MPVRNSTAAIRRQARRRYEREFKSLKPATKVCVCIVPADIVVLDRDPSPCFRCGVRADVPCRHRPWLLRQA